MKTRTPDDGARAYQTEAERHAHAQRTQDAHDRMSAAYADALTQRATFPATTDPTTADPGMQRMAAAFNAAAPAVPADPARSPEPEHTYPPAATGTSYTLNTL